MKTTPELHTRIAELEAEIRLRDERIKELREEQTQHHQLMTEMRELVEDKAAIIDRWIDVFEMQIGDSGSWQFDRSQSDLWNAHEALHNEHTALVRKWNKFVGEYNGTVAPRDIGRPVAASKAQCDKVLKLKKAGASLRAIAAETNLSMRTVRTIVSKSDGTDIATKRTNELRRKELNRQRAAAFRARKARRDQIPKDIAEIKKRAAVLVAAAKGLGR
jgi:uncharacterized coiled-coil protein SlyX